MKGFLLALALFVLMFPATAYPHHSFAAHYFEEQTLTVQGEVVEFEYKSPHAWVHVLAKDDTGQVQRYSAEWANPSRLQQQQITKDTIKVGDMVTITGSPGRNAFERKLHLKRIERPADGWYWRGGGRR